MKIRPLFVIFLMLFLCFNIVVAQDYKITYAEIDRFICKEEESYIGNYEGISYGKKLNQTTAEIFNKEFIVDLNRWHEFNITWSPDKRDSSFWSVLYFLNRSGYEYKVETDGTWYFISLNLPNSSLNEIEDRYYNDFRNNFGWIKSSLSSAIEEASSLNCRAGSDSHHGLLEIFNIYEYPIENLTCDSTPGSIFIDCFNDSVVNNVIRDLWRDIVYKNRKAYISGNNRIFVDLDELRFKQQDFDLMTKPMIVFSESDFSSAIHSGQGVYVDHVEYLKKLEEIPLNISELNERVKEISNFTTETLTTLESIKQERRSGSDQKVKQLILENPFDDKKLKYFIDIQKSHIEEYGKFRELLKSNPRIYYEDIYYDSVDRYLIEYNSKLGLFDSKLKILIDIQSNYDIFTTNTISDINRGESTNRTLIYTLVAILLSTTLFLFKANLDRYGYNIHSLIFAPIALLPLLLYALSKNFFLILGYIIFLDIFLVFFWFLGDLFILTLSRVLSHSSKFRRYLIFQILLPLMEKTKENRLLIFYRLYRKVIEDCMKKDIEDFKKSAEARDTEKFNRLYFTLKNYRPSLQEMNKFWLIDEDDKQKYFDLLVEIEILLKDVKRGVSASGEGGLV